MRHTGGERPRRITIRDVAAAVGVSPMTVSNVINGRTADVGEETRSRVEKAIRALNYRIQRAGRGLRVAARSSVGMIILDESPAFLSDPFTASMVAGLSNVLSAADHTLTIQGVSAAALADALLVRQLVVDGFCVVLSGSRVERRTALKTLLRLEQPLILLQESLPASAVDACVVREDDAHGGRLIAGHLVDAGVSDILVILPKTDWPALENRLAGLRAALKASKAAVRIDVLRAASEEFADVQQALRGHLRQRRLPGAIVGGNDRIALAAMALLQDRGVAIPDDVRIVGFNGFEFTRYARPTLTTVLSPAYQIGKTAGELMLERLAGKPFPTKEIVLPVTLSVGRSSGVAAG